MKIRTVLGLTMLILFLALVLAAPIVFIVHIAYPEPVPYGVWQSENPDLVMDIRLEHSESNVIFTDADGIISILDVGVDTREGYINIWDPSYPEIKPLYSSTLNSTVFLGTYKVKGDQLTLKLYELYQAKTGYKKIVFVKIKDYEVSSESE